MITRTLLRSEDELHELASRRAGFENFGDPAYREGLRALLAAFDSDLNLTVTGQQFVFDTILRGLTARLYAQKGWIEHAETLARPIERPLVIIGLPRSGTTALHRLLSVDPQFQGIEFWLSETPMVRPPRETWQDFPEYRACVETLETRYKSMPGLRKAHESVAEEVEECHTVLMSTFVCTAWSAYRLASYADWLRARSERDSYRWYLNVLRLIGARESQTRWLLKSPQHMVEIELLLEAFPDACIIHTHRDPVSTIPSFCSLLHMVAQNLEGESAERTAFGPWQCAYWRNALDRTQAASQKCPRQFFDVDHRRFVEDPLGTVRAIYHYFGLTLSPHAAQQMQTWAAASPTSRHGEHRYAIDSWGITRAQLCAVFEDYRARYHFN